MFADRAKIYIRSGKGGDGHASFRRELYVPNGGPDGGDGGRGGDVIFEVDEGLNTLVDYRHKRKYCAKDGEQGGKRRCHGKDAEDIILRVPEGTVIKEAESGKVIADMSGENRRQIILKGGKGGLGNQHFATATMQVPKYAQPGQPAQELDVLLELKVIADVGLVGFCLFMFPTFKSFLCAAKQKNEMICAAISACLLSAFFIDALISRYVWNIMIIAMLYYNVNVKQKDNTTLPYFNSSLPTQLNS